MIGNLREIMMESSLIQEAIEQGRYEGAKKSGQDAVLENLSERFGSVPAEVEAFVRGVADEARLRRLLRASIRVPEPAGLLAVE